MSRIQEIVRDDGYSGCSFASQLMLILEFTMVSEASSKIKPSKLIKALLITNKPFLIWSGASTLCVQCFGF